VQHEPYGHPEVTVCIRRDKEPGRRLAGHDRCADLGRRAVAGPCPAPAGAGPSAKVLAAGAELYLPLAGLLDLEAERARLERERDALDAEARRAATKLANADFVAKAPAAVVDRARARLAEVEAARVKVVERIRELAATTGG